MEFTGIYIIVSYFCVIAFANHQNIPSVEPRSAESKHCNCGKGQEGYGGDEDSLEGRVVNGYKPIHRPWMVYLKMIYTDNRSGKCGGSLLTERWIISAGHCFCQRNGAIAKLCEKRKKGGRKMLKLLWKRHGGEMKEIQAIIGINDLRFRDRSKNTGTYTTLLSMFHSQEF